jgi:hypothetical protein
MIILVVFGAILSIMFGMLKDLGIAGITWPVVFFPIGAAVFLVVMMAFWIWVSER